MNDENVSRKEFLKKTAIGAAGITLGMSAKSYSNILGANDRVHCAIAGMHNRGQAHLEALNKVPNAQVKYLCDVDSRVLEKTVAHARDLTGSEVIPEPDIRRLVEKKDIDAITIATPDHWHAPMTLMGIQNGKHVYVEKPCCHNPAEGEMMVASQKKYNKLIQMGTQTRSEPGTPKAANYIRGGGIGDVYMGKARYGNNRKSIGEAEAAPVPSWLDWDLWQGPAPHQQYEPIWVHYNWHWNWNWGTGEINNNGIHAMDICRLMLGLDDQNPVKATSAGGRYTYDDAWQFYDTQVASFEYEDDKMITWEGRSCFNTPVYEKPTINVIVYGTKGALVHDDNGPMYRAYDLEGNKMWESGESTDNVNEDKDPLRGMGSSTTLHFKNFIDAIRGQSELHSPIDISYKSNLLAHLGNYAQKTGDALHINSQNGHIMDNPTAMKMWSREYEPGWEPSV